MKQLLERNCLEQDINSVSRQAVSLIYFTCLSLLTLLSGLGNFQRQTLRFYHWLSQWLRPTYQCCPYPPLCPPDPPHFPPLSKCSLSTLHPPPPQCLLPLSLCVPSWAQCLIVFTYYFSLSGYHFIWNYVQWQVTAILLRSGLVRIEICYSLASWLLFLFYTECHFFPHIFPFSRSMRKTHTILRSPRSHIFLIFHKPALSPMVSLFREAGKCCLIVRWQCMSCQTWWAGEVACDVGFHLADSWFWRKRGRMGQNRNWNVVF